MLLEILGKNRDRNMGPCGMKAGARRTRRILALTSTNMAGKSKGFFLLRTTCSIIGRPHDEFEGEAYKRVLVKVKFEDGSIVDAHIYTLDQREVFHSQGRQRRS